MKARTKKILAREFLYLIGTTVLGLILYLISNVLFKYYNDKLTVVEAKYESLVGNGQLIVEIIELEDLYDVTIEGVFSSKEEFISFASKANNDEIFSLIKKGIFESPEEMASYMVKKQSSWASEKYLQKVFQALELDESMYEVFKNVISSNEEYNRKVFNHLRLNEAAYSSFKRKTGLRPVQNIINQKALKDAFTLFQQAGYNKSIEDFKTLVRTNKDALSDAYVLFTNAGYNKSIDDFAKLIGVSGVAEPKDIVIRGSSSMEPTNSALPQEDRTGLLEFGELPEDIREDILNITGGNANEVLQTQEKIRRIKIAKFFFYDVVYTEGYLIFALSLLFFVFRYVLYATKWSITQLRKS